MRDDVEDGGVFNFVPAEMRPKWVQDKQAFYKNPGNALSHANSVEAIALAVMGLEDKFYFGRFKKVRSIRIKYWDKVPSLKELVLPSVPCNRVGEEGDECMPSERLSTLLGASDQSAFGDGDQTRMDSTVRSARHIAADRIVEVDGLDLPSIVQEVKNALFPAEQAPITAEVSR